MNGPDRSTTAQHESLNGPSMLDVHEPYKYMYFSGTQDSSQSFSSSMIPRVRAKLAVPKGLRLNQLVDDTCTATNSYHTYGPRDRKSTYRTPVSSLEPKSRSHRESW